MRSHLSPLLCILGLAAASGAAAHMDGKADIEKETKKFQGTWMVERVEAGGMEVPIELFKEMRLTYAGDKYTVKVGEQVIQAGTQKVDPSKSPKTFDVKVSEGASQGTVILGIYEISDDKLKICFDPEGKKRPTEFKTEAGSQITNAVYKRQKE